MKRSIDGQCDRCAHVWPVAHLPMPILGVARLLMTAACPACACPTVFVARMKGSS